MLNRYKFSMDFPPEGNLRVEEVASFLELMRQAFDVSFWTYQGEHFEISKLAIQKYFATGGALKPPSTGADLVLSPSVGSYPIMLSSMTGLSEYVWDFMWVDFHATDPVPDLSYFSRCIDGCRPTVAEISHSDNLETLNFGDRAYAQGRKGVRYRPIIINWLQYFNKQMADTFGGLAKCLQTPAYNVEPFCDGILIQLTPEPFNPTSEKDLAAQRLAMEYLGLPWEFKKDA